MRVVVGGGSGFVGSALCRLLGSRGHTVTLVSRSPGSGRVTWEELKARGLPPCDAALNLAGLPAIDPLRRWSPELSAELRSSRVETTAALARAVSEAKPRPHTWLLVTGVGYYRPSRTAHYTEDSPGGDSDFWAQLVTAWETAAKLPGSQQESAVRQVVVRPGLVLGKGGGAMSRMVWPFWLGLGGPIGNGKQPFPWVHVDDLAGIIAHALETPSVCGVLNAVAPSAVSNADFARELGRALGRPALLPMPGFFVNAMLGRERGLLLLQGQSVSPKRTLESGYRFKFPELAPALEEVVS
ncbi:epimerase family protein SDR39U1 [Petromyzon marinus]|uniref:Epimerase family protein SDR39U1 n=1 Tax=Petromyzon marinus TaxID=7757 RepID=S4S1R7_PETMA|nr:epimerase family protein SDR39U1 [Petromyzon marinus]